jgi:hypothetical protein
MKRQHPEGELNFIQTLRDPTNRTMYRLPDLITNEPGAPEVENVLNEEEIEQIM